MHRKKWNEIKCLIGSLQEKRSEGIWRRMWEENIKEDLEIIVYNMNNFLG
jgi:hypothetical protein